MRFQSELSADSSATSIRRCFQSTFTAHLAVGLLVKQTRQQRLRLTSGTLLTAPTTVEVSHRATTAPTAYSTTDVLFSVFSHCAAPGRNQ